MERPAGELLHLSISGGVRSPAPPSETDPLGGVELGGVTSPDNRV